jgi:hypothetical protein
MRQHFRDDTEPHSSERKSTCRRVGHLQVMADTARDIDDQNPTGCLNFDNVESALPPDDSHAWRVNRIEDTIA